jgi:hypothetical protein
MLLSASILQYLLSTKRGRVCSFKKKMPASENRFVRDPYLFRSPLDEGYKSGQRSEFMIIFEDMSLLGSISLTAYPLLAAAN